MATEKSRTAYQKWYQTNKASFNEKRKKKYHSDPEVREKAISNAKKYRQENPRQNGEEQHYREVGGKVVEVFRITETANRIGRSVESIRSWEKKGWIPTPSIDSTHRYYTIKQIQLLKDFAEFIDQVRYDREVRALAIKKKSSELYSLWG